MTTSIDIAKKIAEVNRPLCKESVHALAAALVGKKYRKGEILLQAGETCRSILFIEKGMLRQFYYKHGKDLTEPSAMRMASLSASKATSGKNPPA